MKKSNKKINESPFGIVLSTSGALFLVLYFGYHFGVWIDEKLSTEPFGLVSVILIGVTASIKLAVNEIIAEGKKGSGSNNENNNLAEEDSEEEDWI